MRRPGIWRGDIPLSPVIQGAPRDTHRVALAPASSSPLFRRCWWPSTSTVLSSRVTTRSMSPSAVALGGRLLPPPCHCYALLESFLGITFIYKGLLLTAFVDRHFQSSIWPANNERGVPIPWPFIPQKATNATPLKFFWYETTTGQASRTYLLFLYPLQSELWILPNFAVLFNLISKYYRIRCQFFFSEKNAAKLFGHKIGMDLSGSCNFSHKLQWTLFPFHTNPTCNTEVMCLSFINSAKLSFFFCPKGPDIFIFIPIYSFIYDFLKMMDFGGPHPWKNWLSLYWWFLIYPMQSFSYDRQYSNMAFKEVLSTLISISF